MHENVKLISQRIITYWSYFWIGLFTLIGGVYISFHLNYLDDPRVTAPPPPAAWERLSFGFADDWWFALLFTLAGVILLIGVFNDSRWFRNVGLVLVAPLYGALAYAFIVRGLFDYRFNLTWVFAFLAIGWVIETALRGDWRDD